jgi:leader peptidase (prepilin peptidase) / N-methyltransferase
LADVSGVAVALAAVLGLIFGSFATVVAYRIPKNESVASGRSKCPNCGRTIPAAENIPVLSYLALRGRCRGCGNPISIRYPLIEVATGLLFGLAVWKFGLSAEAVVFAAFFLVLVVLSAIDLEYRLLPNRIVYPAFVGGWVALAAIALVDGMPERLVDAAVGALVFGGFFVVVAFLFPAGMGGGDVKLGFVVGTFLGYLDGLGIVLAGMFLAFLTGSVIGIGLILFAGRGRKSMLPFGPFLALGTVLAVFMGRPLVDGYLGLL